MRAQIAHELDESATTIVAMADACAEAIVAAASMVAASFRTGGKLMICGNGGSAADAQHLATELVGAMAVRDRPGLPAMALTTDTSILTAVGNDITFDEVFARQVEALGRPGDVLLAISTSGDSPNVLRAVERARAGWMHSIALTGPRGVLRQIADLAIEVPATNTQRQQEGHIAAGHILCGLVERLCSVPVEAFAGAGAAR